MSQQEVNMHLYIRISVVLVFSVFMLACEPSDDNPGMWLGGEVTAYPEDFSFTSDVREIFVQVQTPYWIAHSVTIWCVEINGTLYVGALDPDSKKWPGWVMDSPQVNLKIAGKLYEAELVPVSDKQLKRQIAAEYMLKYELSPGSLFEGDPSAVYWSVKPTS